MSLRSITTGQPDKEGGEIILQANQILRHAFNRKPDSQNVIIKRIPTSAEPPVFTSPYYLANIGTNEDQLLLELRFVPIDNRIRIALLMTNERSVRDLDTLGKKMFESVRYKGINFSAVIGIESLGSKLAQEIARCSWLDNEKVFLSSLQKGKAVMKEGQLKIGSPKVWISNQYASPVYSGTSEPGTQQWLYFDQDYGELLKQVCTPQSGILIVDDARLTQGTINAAVALFKKNNIPISGIATVLNESNPTDNIDGIPYVGLTKLPLFGPVEGGLKPIPDTYQGLNYFYVEQ